jgi:segregation and condensation protein A
VTDTLASDAAEAAVAEADLVTDPVDDAWGDPPRAVPVEVGAPVLSVEGFEGPLDWLLERVRAHRIDLARLSILSLADAFVGAMEAAFGRDVRDPPVSLPQWGDWLVMAAQLTELRSKLLLPAHDPEARAAHSQAEMLRRQLISRKQAGAAADWLERRPQLGRDVFARGVPEGDGGTLRTSRFGDITELLRACLVALRLDEQQAEAYRLPPTPWPVHETIARLRQRMTLLPDRSPLSDYLPVIPDGDQLVLRTRAAVASTLIAGLELARDGQLSLDQDDTWQAIRVGRRDADDAASAA